VPVFNAYTTEKNPFHLAMVHEPVLQDMATGAERIWFSQEVARVPATEASFAAFRRRAETLGAPPLVIHSREELLRRTAHAGSHPDTSSLGVTAIEGLSAARRIGADVLRYLPEELVFEVHPATDGWLLLTDRWARGWEAEVNGHRTRMYVGNFIFRAIRVSAGANRIRFTYRPAGFPWLVLVSWGTLAAMTLGAVVTGTRSRADRTTTDLLGDFPALHLPSNRLADQ
jgi:hypothetical protein